MSCFRFAGETVECAIDLPLVPSDTDSPDVRVTIGYSDRLHAPEMGTLLHRGGLEDAPWAMGTLADGGGWGFVFGHGCVATMTPDRSEIAITTLPQAPDEWLGETISGWALVFRLAAGGRSTFHASSVTLDGSTAISISGPGHSGKSTMAAAAVALGGGLLGDDVMASRIDGERVLIQSTASRMKLRGAAKMIDTRLAGTGTTTFDDRLSVSATNSHDNVALSAIYFLDRSESSGIRPLASNETVVRLIDNSKVGSWLWDDARDREFDTACEIAERVPGFVLGRSEDLDSVDDLLDVATSLFVH